MKYIICIPALIVLASCASKPTRLIESEWTSMTRSEVPKLSEVREVGLARGEYCHSSFNSGHFGLMDEAISQAQKKYNIDYIRNATFMYDSNSLCVSVEGTGYRRL